ncbi:MULTISPECIES: sigma-70 family RNA polymerase sigma factor [Streptomyces]|uniref:sigma-70 family RNA polymerase sigma factor n=1 Tax=Streptomyces TaxID=1883 RepID=UPI001E4B971F|nr:sigma-70 family RNA polymerase sigma factor [Streptomyces sp. MNU103]
MPEAIEGGENTASTPMCPLDAEDAELTPDDLSRLDRALGAITDPRDAARRRQADATVVEMLRAHDFAGPRYQKVVNRLSEYGYHTMVKWTASGEIFRKARQAGRPVPVQKVTLRWTPEDRHGVVVDSVLGGLHVFRTYGLVQRRWRPDGGASLDTYFIGAVIRAFPRVYIRWFDGHQRMQTELNHSREGDESADVFSLVPDQRAADPAHTAVTSDYLDRLLPLVTDPQVREALGWRAMGYTQKHAAQRAGLTEKALERRTRRLRDRLAQQVRQLELGEGGAR